jgi:hypothetical protein
MIFTTLSRRYLPIWAFTRAGWTHISNGIFLCPSQSDARQQTKFHSQFSLFLTIPIVSDRVCRKKSSYGYPFRRTTDWQKLAVMEMIGLESQRRQAQWLDECIGQSIGKSFAWNQSHNTEQKLWNRLWW